MKRTIQVLVIISVFLILFGSLYGVDIRDTRLLSQPAVSDNHIAFVYAGDLWACDRDGSNVRRLTTDDGVESNPVFSPDGNLIAFTAQYDGNRDVFVVPTSGGVPKRLTWHPGFDVVRGFSPDGRSVLFISPRSVFTNRFTKLFTVSVDGGMPVELQIPNASKAAYSPDGTRLAYTPLGERFRQWKNYRGGTASRIWLYNFSDHAVEQIPQPEGRCNDTDPMWIGDKVYFISDRNGEFNVFSFNTRNQRVQQLTEHEDFPVISASAGGGRIVYEQAGYLHLLNPGNSRSTKLTVGVAADLIERRPRYAKGGSFIRFADISPTGARAVFEARGEVVTVPAKKGDARNLTNSVSAHDRFPAWSPDGRKIAYFSDASGEYALYVAPSDGKGEVRQYQIAGNGFYENPVWAPDSKKLSFFDNSLTLYWIDLDSGEVKSVASEYYYSPMRPNYSTWSPDSNWIVYTIASKAYFQTIYAYSIQEEESFAITDGLSEASSPVFDKSGKYLYFFASTDAGPVKHWFAQSNADMSADNSLYLAVLQKGVESPLAKESDEEEIKEDEKEEEEEEKEETSTEEADEKAKPEKEPFKIDFEGLTDRIVTVPVRSGNLRSLRAGDDGEIFYLRSPSGGGPFSSGGGSELQKYSLKDRKEETLLSGVQTFTISADRKKALYLADGGKWGIGSSKGKIKPGDGILKTDAIRIKIDPVAEWEQIYTEAWRINRDFFYDPNFHGADWEALRGQYAAFLPHLSSRTDLNRVIQWLCSELSVGHHRVFGGDQLNSPETVPGGLLGADFEVHEGRYRFKKVYGGLNWTPQLRSPLTEPGVDVQPGEYLLSVNGAELNPPTNLFSLFEATAEKIVEMEVGPNSDGTDSRFVKVTPIRNESALRNRDWVEGNLKKVDEATDGRVAYVYVPNTAGSGHTYFKRYFFPQSHKDAIIVDERFNGGGQIADYYIDILRRPYASMWATRYGADFKSPSASIQGPKVMLIDETAGSGGDMLPWMFRKFELGKLVGKRTWGGLVGMLGFPPLMDGGYVTAPNLAIWTEDGFIVENVGVPPDIEVEQLPAEVIQGKDPQLEKAIEVILEELEKNPPAKRERPPFPTRVRK
jgi:tricorn protease